MDADEDSLAHIGPVIGMSCARGKKPKLHNTPCQDDYCIIADERSCFIGVFDGHGEMGHSLANSAQTSVSSTVLDNFEMFQSDAPAALKYAIEKADAVCTDILGSEESGTTATLSMITPGNITVGWVGDSLAKVGRWRNAFDPASDLGTMAEWILEPITIAHKPSDDVERRRICNAGGRVDDPEDGSDSRVHELDRQGPGLAMSRSLGDQWGHRLGVSSEPDIETRFTKCMDFFCVGSDGVWDMLHDDEVAVIIGTCGRDQPQAAADQIKEIAWQRWSEDENGYVDDISFFVIWLPFGEAEVGDPFDA